LEKIEEAIKKGHSRDTGSNGVGEYNSKNKNKALENVNILKSLRRV
jgi:hypothetical protein